MLEIINISKNYGGIHAIKNLSLRIKRRKLTAIIGPNGAGKTTLINIISRLVKEDSGDLKLNNFSIKKMNVRQIAKLGISRTFQKIYLFQDLTLKDHLNLCFNSSLLSSFFFGNSRYFEKENKKIKKILAITGMGGSLNKKVSELSYGQQKLIDFSMALLMPHKLIMLDEPVSGINPKLRKKMAKILRQLIKEGESILMVEHDMDFVSKIADEVIVLHQGELITQGNPNKVLSNRRVIDIYLGD
ncbi:ATP-binding cassette domain-containing protein [Candidatus Woesearchaeota archaeon]|nr:ATP-binding cassette domain-containing protein [Candidatus Woesearchaeota archaeon]